MAVGTRSRWVAFAAKQGLALALAVGWTIAGCASGASAPLRQDGGGSRDAGPADAALVRPDTGPADSGTDTGPVVYVGTCETCTAGVQCEPGARCVELTGGGSACLPTCDRDLPICPRNFRCVDDLTSAGSEVCVPIGERCCVDEDTDGYGSGAGCRGRDYNDREAAIHPEADEQCNAINEDCDESVDEAAIDCGAQRCDATPAGTYEAIPPGLCTGGECNEVGRTSCGLYSCIDGADEGDFCATSCALGGIDSDAHCILAAHCDLGFCAPDEENGEACDEDSDCESAHCDNGFCCDDGACCSVATDCPSSGGVGTTCDDSATCQGSRGEVLCQDNECTTREGVSDDSACDSTIEANTCGPYRSISCSGAANQTPPSCPTTCDDDADCDGDAHCDVVCIPDGDDGSVCDEDSDCRSDHCNGNVCCAGGDCCQTAFDCPASYGTAPTCDAPSACQGTRDAVVCSDFVCATAPDVPDDSACTAAIEASACALYPSRFCSGGTDQSPPVCAMACSADSDCDENAHCDLMACVPDLPNGQACDETSDCASGHCQNGFCCGSGDCCSIGFDCPTGVYGEPPECDSAATCQGSRRDPVCNAASQCALGNRVDDDTACSGLLANACDLYPSVSCTNQVAQPTDQAARCASSCTSDAGCDPGAFCMTGACVPRGMRGDACTSTAQCGSGLQCVDGVCCGSACTGTCMACNVPGSLGTCAPVPNDTDPANECGAVSCSSYYHGWTADRWYRRTNAPASAVSCNGAGACQSAATVCASRGRGTIQVDCDDTCQTPRSGTCSGTTAGACNNQPAGSQSCGVGACYREDTLCNAGTQVECVPGEATGEWCNDVDDDCNGSIDDGMSGDGYEWNSDCASATYLGRVYTQNTSSSPSSVVVWPTLYDGWDVDYFRADWSENDSSCGCSFPSTDEDYGLTASLTVPWGAGSYRICALMGGTCGVGSNCAIVGEGTTGSVTIWKDGCCSVGACNDSGTGWFVVEPWASPGFSCYEYQLQVQTVRGCR